TEQWIAVTKQLSEHWLEFFLEVAGVFETDHFVAKNAMAIVEKRSRQSFDAAKLLDQIRRCNRKWIVHSNFFRKPGWIFAVPHDVGLESHDSKSTRPVLVEQFLIARHFFFARLGPRCPNIDQHHLASKVGR